MKWGTDIFDELMNRKWAARKDGATHVSTCERTCLMGRGEGKKRSLTCLCALSEEQECGLHWKISPIFKNTDKIETCYYQMEFLGGKIGRRSGHWLKYLSECVQCCMCVFKKDLQHICKILKWVKSKQWYNGYVDSCYKSSTLLCLFKFYFRINI